MTSSPYPIAFVTGTSSGIGEALARELLERGWRVVGAARRPAAIQDRRYTHLEIDLADLGAVTAALDAQVRPLLGDPRVNRVGLVNNAALVGLLGRVAQIDPFALRDVYAVNVVAPIFLMGWFFRQGRTGVPVRMVNVSSGAAVNPYPGMGAYGSSKAALRMAGMIFAGELEAAAAGAQRDATLFSYEPGLVDTPMQTAARTSSAETLPVVQLFVDWAAAGALVAPIHPARRIADYLGDDGHPRWMEERYQPASPGPQTT